MSEMALSHLPMEHGLFLAAILFAMGFISVLIRRNIIFVLMSLEIMLNATALAFITAAARWQQADGQIMFVIILTIAAAEAATGLALIVQLYKRHQTLDIDLLNQLKG